ncbi:MAG: hypothetical protein IPM13_06465 [Phycisphaerales bacterium]|nr:hypothetical protein [Phycisphaerales bacterium]
MHPQARSDGEDARSLLTAAIEADLRAPVGPPCPVDRVPRRTRNQYCIAIIALGLFNYLVYTLTYAALGGDAHNGTRRIISDADGRRHAEYFVKGHFIHSLSGHERQVSRAAWIYSYIHSISVPLTSGAMIISMLILARPHIIATMRGGLVAGETVVTVFGTVAVLISVGTATLFTWNLVAELAKT